MAAPHIVRGTQLISKACGLLNIVARHQNGLSLTDLSNQTGLHPTTAYRILQALVLEGLLIQDEDSGRYRLGYGLIKLGEQAKRSNDLIRIAAPHVKKLAELWGETVLLDTINRNFDVVTVYSQVSSYRLGIILNSDKPIPAHCLAAGKILLAGLPPQRLDDYLNQNFIQYTPQTITDADKIRETLEIVRRQGYSLNLEEYEVSFNAVGAAVRDSNQRVVAAVSVGGPSTRLTPALLSAVIESVIQTADAISADLGYRTE